jgi:hypothetical protein
MSSKIYLSDDEEDIITLEKGKKQTNKIKIEKDIQVGGTTPAPASPPPPQNKFQPITKEDVKRITGKEFTDEAVEQVIKPKKTKTPAQMKSFYENVRPALDKQYEDKKELMEYKRQMKKEQADLRRQEKEERKREAQERVIDKAVQIKKRQLTDETKILKDDYEIPEHILLKLLEKYDKQKEKKILSSQPIPPPTPPTPMAKDLKKMYNFI